MAHGKRWTVDISWLDDEGNEATTSYNSFDNNAEVVNVVADAVAKFCKATYHPTIIGTYVEMYCVTCGYESENEFYSLRTYLCDCDKKSHQEQTTVRE